MKRARGHTAVFGTTAGTAVFAGNMPQVQAAKTTKMNKKTAAQAAATSATATMLGRVIIRV